MKKPIAVLVFLFAGAFHAFAGDSSKKKFFPDVPSEAVYDAALEFITEEWTLLNADVKSIEFRASETCEGTIVFREKDDGTEILISTRKRRAILTWGEEGRKRKDLINGIVERLEEGS